MIGSESSPLSTLYCIVNHLEEDRLKAISYADDIAPATGKEGVAVAGGSHRQRPESGKGKVHQLSVVHCTDSRLPMWKGRGAIEKMKEFRNLDSNLFGEGSVDCAVRERMNVAWLK
ncbi:unnamed protein product [Heligmosomoides polygyrus]|uniref:Uncharacterized protein n=1 Tax=Heligmosomoides polygyrus TaxID=6339 RepID=A0A183FD60_HELPZ|nr:unnamed protein product [Heligmosomoides polygyrus]